MLDIILYFFISEETIARSSASNITSTIVADFTNITIDTKPESSDILVLNRALVQNEMECRSENVEETTTEAVRLSGMADCCIYYDVIFGLCTFYENVE